MMIPMVFYTFLLLISSFAAATHGSKNRDDCPNRCGDVIIKYPFGVGSDCSVDANFTLTCNGSLPILTKFDLEVIDFGEDYTNTIIVNNPIFKFCNKTVPKEFEVRFNSSLDLSGSPFSFSSSNHNALVSVGCDAITSLYDETGDKVGGCSSVCGAIAPEATKGCYGYNCCQSNNFGIMSRFSVGVVVSRTAAASNGSCRYAFLTSKNFVKANTNGSVAASFQLIPSSGVVPVVLYWGPYNYGNNWSTGKLVGVIIGVYVAPIGLGTLLLSSCGCWLGWFYTTKKRRKEVKLRAKYFKGRLEQSFSDREIVEKTKLFTINELKKATENFSEDRILGQGGQGTVYKGMLTNGQVIAVKKSKAFDENQWKQFINEVILLSQVNHKNIVKLFGCCLETKEPLIVYEFVPNGTLSRYLHNPTSEMLLTWEMRVKIATEIAGAIGYLHSSCSLPIYHRDIKSTNILLDDKFQAKVSDFGISKAISADQTHLTTCVQGTFGYLDPEYFRSSQFSEKSDVYSFGVILVELLTRQQPIRITTSEEEKSLVLYFISSMTDSSLDEILDPMVKQESTKEEVMVVANLAKQCLKPRGIQRPTMKEVAMELQALRKSRCYLSNTTRNTSFEVEFAAPRSMEVMENAHTCPIIEKGGIIHGNCVNVIDDDERPLFCMTL